MSNILTLTGGKPLIFNSKILVNLKSLEKATNLKAWYTARKITSPPADNTAVSSFPDHSNNGTAVSQATGSAQPKYRTGIINGLPAYQFDGSDYLTFTSNTLTQNKAGLTSYIVYKRTSGVTGQTLLYFPNSANATKHGIVINSGTGADNIAAQARRTTESGVLASHANQDTSFHVIANVTDYTNNLLSLWVDGELKSTAAIGGTSGANSENAASSAGASTISNSGGFFTGYLGELMFCDAAHTGKEVVDIMSALRRIYGGLPQ